jgi:molybdate transport system regulatory protein
MPLTASGRLWFSWHETHFLGPNRVSLLEQIAELGSISRAAKALGMSYKGAWDSIEAMNHLSEKPLVIRVSGGRGGGGSQVTPHGLRLIGLFRSAEESFHKYLVTLNEQVATELGTLASSSPALAHLPNRIDGTIARIGDAGETVEVVVLPDGGGEVRAHLPGSLPEVSGLRAGLRVGVLIKPTDVHLLGEGEYATVLSANALPGQIEQITEGAVDARIQVRLDAGWILTAMQALGSSREVLFPRGRRVLAVFHPADVLLTTVKAEE